MYCCKPKKNKILLFVAILLILNLCLVSILGYYSTENKYSNDRQLYILNEVYHKVEEAKLIKVINSKNSRENTALFAEWKGYKNENSERILERIGVPWIIRKIAGIMNPTEIIRRKSDTEITFETHFVIATTRVTFVLNELTQFQPYIGPAMDIIMTWFDNKLVANFVESGKGDPKKSPAAGTCVREVLENGEMLLTLIWGKDVSKMWFRRVGTAPTSVR